MNLFIVLHLLTATLVAGKMMGFGEYSWLQAFAPSIAAIPMALIVAIFYYITNERH